ncbi:MAG: UpxY family transcription antiterminator, partial [Pedobacter sp.]|nr:UpxY family transcription antiterminator [Pedobacter sp.]
FITNHYNIKLERASLNIHDTVKILDGPFYELEGNIISIKKNYVKLLIPSLRFFMTAEIEISNVAKVLEATLPSQHIAIS